MPVFYIDSMDIDPGEFLDNCGRGEREELIDLLVKDGYVLLPEGNLIGSQLENEHMEVVKLLIPVSDPEVVKEIEQDEYFQEMR